MEAALAGRARCCAAVQPRDRAHEVFARLRVWDTRANNGVLMYLLLADHRIEIVADRGFDGRVDATSSGAACAQLIEERLRAGEPASRPCVRGDRGGLGRCWPRISRATDAARDETNCRNRPRVL